MFVGHYGVSFAAKRWAPRVPLWLLFIAAQFLDLLWAPFILLGIEKARVIPGFMPGSPLDLYYLPYTHGLLTAIFWSVLMYAVIRYVTCREWPVSAPIIVGATVFSHWVLDLLTHGPDLPLIGDEHKVGLGLWNYPGPELTLEILFLFGGIWFSGAWKNRKWGWWVFGVVMLAGQLSDLLSPPPPNIHVVATMALAAYVIFAGVAWWLEGRGRKASVVGAETRA